MCDTLANMVAIDASVHRVRAFVGRPEMTASQLAKLAGLSPNALRAVERDDWSPTLKTLRRCEKAIEQYLATEAARSGKAA